MVRKRDAFADFDDIVTKASTISPWNLEPGRRMFVPDYPLLEALFSVPVTQQSPPQSGKHAKAVDVWAAEEFRRAGFAPDAIWPRRIQPRILSDDLVYLLSKLPPGEREVLEKRIDDIKRIGPSDARIFGRAYEKQVDVVMSRWNTGPQLLLSTKTQVASFAKNLPNRFEEAYGDTANLRTRFPLAAVGFLFVQRSTILHEEWAAFERTLDMMQKLRDRGDGSGYTATGLMLLEWDDTTAEVTVLDDPIPEDLQVGQMFTALIDTILETTPITEHLEARELRHNRKIEGIRPED